MTFTLERFSDPFGKPEQIEINTLDDLCNLCKNENHKIIFDARDRSLIVWDEMVFCYDGEDSEFVQ